MFVTLSELTKKRNSYEGVYWSLIRCNCVRWGIYLWRDPTEQLTNTADRQLCASELPTADTDWKNSLKNIEPVKKLRSLQDELKNRESQLATLSRQLETAQQQIDPDFQRIESHIRQ